MRLGNGGGGAGPANQDSWGTSAYGFGYNNTYSIDIVSDDVVLCSDLGGGYYFIDLTYRTETVGLEGPVQEDNRTRLLVVRSDDGMLIEAMFNY